MKRGAPTELAAPPGVSGVFGLTMRECRKRALAPSVSQSARRRGRPVIRINWATHTGQKRSLCDRGAVCVACMLQICARKLRRHTAYAARRTDVSEGTPPAVITQAGYISPRHVAAALQAG